MEINNIRNMIILKDLPSNMVEEAIIVLKQNQKVKKLEYIENKFENISSGKLRYEGNEYVIKEAELLVSEYMKKYEKNKYDDEKKGNSLEKKYKKLKKISIFFGIFFSIVFWIIL